LIDAEWADGWDGTGEQGGTDEPGMHGVDVGWICFGEAGGWR